MTIANEAIDACKKQGGAFLSYRAVELQATVPRGAGKCTSSWEGLFKTPSLVSMWESVS